jgi:hypothetical protein
MSVFCFPSFFLKHAVSRLASNSSVTPSILQLEWNPMACLAVSIAPKQQPTCWCLLERVTGSLLEKELFMQKAREKCKRIGLTMPRIPNRRARKGNSNTLINVTLNRNSIHILISHNNAKQDGSCIYQQ